MAPKTKHCPGLYGSRNVYYMRHQLRTRTTCGKNSRDLTVGELNELRQRIDGLRAERARIRAGQQEAVIREEEASTVASEAEPYGEHMYIMQRSDAPGVLKVGRSNDPMKRATQLQSGHCFSVSVLATFPHAGSKERAVHDILHPRLVSEGPGREWFRVSFSQAVSAVVLVVGC